MTPVYVPSLTPLGSCANPDCRNHGPGKVVAATLMDGYCRPCQPKFAATTRESPVEQLSLDGASG